MNYKRPMLGQCENNRIESIGDLSHIIFKDDPTLPLKGAEAVYTEPEGVPKTTVLCNPAI